MTQRKAGFVIKSAIRTLRESARKGLASIAGGGQFTLFMHPAVLLPLVILLFVFADIVGWIFHIPLLTSVLARFPTMKPNTALALGLLATCCLARGKPRHETNGRRGWISTGALGIAMALSCGTLLEYASGKDFGLDNFLLAASSDWLGDPPGRMALGTALCLTLSGLALGLLYRAPRISVWILLSTNGITVSTLISFAVNAGPLFNVPWLRSLSVPTALCLVLLAGAALVARPERSSTSFPLRSESDAGSRPRLIDNFVVLPLLMAAPSVVAMHAHVSEAILTLLILAVLLFSAEIWLNHVRNARLQKAGRRP